MAYYRVNKNKQANGDNEVHKSDCKYYFLLTNFEELGFHSTCTSAVDSAKSKGYYSADGCNDCIPFCHKR